MAAGRDGDTAVWLHNKLGSTDDLWSGSSICSHLTRERLLSIQECFQHLQPHVKVKLMLSFLHLPKRSVEEVISLNLKFICSIFCTDYNHYLACYTHGTGNPHPTVSDGYHGHGTCYTAANPETPVSKNHASATPAHRPY